MFAAHQTTRDKARNPAKKNPQKKKTKKTQKPANPEISLF